MTAATTTAKPRAWIPEYDASYPGSGGAVQLVASELLSRTPADVLLTTVLEALSAGDREPAGVDAIAEAIHELRTAAYRVGCEVAGMVDDYGQPGTAHGWEPYLTELADRAGVELVAGQVEADGLFHEAQR